MATTTDRELLVTHRIQSGLRNPDSGRERALFVAEEVLSMEFVEEELIRFSNGEEFDLEEVDFRVEHLRRARKVAEVVEEEYGVDVGHGKFAEAATTAAKLNSYTSILIAVNNVIRDSKTLVEEYDSTDDIQEIPEETYDNFYRSCFVFVLECLLFYTPINYKIAWRGTRYLNNQYLYHLRNHSMALYRLVLSEIHYVIRDVVPSVLQRSVDAFASYLVWATTSSIEILHQHGAIDSENIREKLEESVSGFIEFAKDTYSVGESLINSVSVRDVYSAVLSRLSAIVDFSLPSVNNLDTTFRDQSILSKRE